MDLILILGSGKFPRVSVKPLLYQWPYLDVLQNVLPLRGKSRQVLRGLAKFRNSSPRQFFPRLSASFPGYTGSFSTVKRQVSLASRPRYGKPKACPMILILASTFPRKYHSFKFTGLTIHSLNHSSRKLPFETIVFLTKYAI